MLELRREKYLSRIRPFYKDTDIIKVLTGARRCGKSTILRQIIDELREEGVDGRSLVYLDLDSKKYLSVRTSDALEKLIDSGFGDCQSGRYLFIDEIQNVRDFEPLINAYRNDGVSVFITGSNSYLLSGELVTKLTGRYVEFRISTFSLSEVREFYRINGMAFTPSEAFQDYLLNGGYPKSFEYADQDSKSLYIRSVIDETIEKDILRSKKVRNRALMGKLLDYILSTPGAEISSTSIADYLRSERMMTTPNTVNGYLDLIFSSKLADKCVRFDIFGKKALKTHYKSYVADISLHTSYPNVRRDLKMGHILENIVFNELRSRGYDVQVGKLRDIEVDFVVSNRKDIAYIQVTYLMASPETEEREERPLLKIEDNYPKYIISMDPIAIDRKGIKRLRLVEDFLLGDGFRF
ncbi:MAG: ATP-binding protein [Candidatus Methanomethylophilaceae archaeon]|nr:ATP-binding protein [Candidatus Methanomethylophilaceae archaeon]